MSNNYMAYIHYIILKNNSIFGKKLQSKESGKKKPVDP